MNLSEICREAAHIMSERGHCKGTLRDENGAVCLNGALLEACALIEEEKAYVDSIFRRTPAPMSPALTEFHKMWEKIAGIAVTILAEQDRYPDFGIINWNDDGKTSAEDVILLLKQCGERLADA